MANLFRGTDDMGGYYVEPASIDGSAHLLVEIAGLLHEGQLDDDLGTMARAPRSQDHEQEYGRDFTAHLGEAMGALR